MAFQKAIDWSLLELLLCSCSSRIQSSENFTSSHQKINNKLGPLKKNWYSNYLLTYLLVKSLKYSLLGLNEVYSYSFFSSWKCALSYLSILVQHVISYSRIEKITHSRLVFVRDSFRESFLSMRARSCYLEIQITEYVFNVRQHHKNTADNDIHNWNCHESLF